MKLTLGQGSPTRGGCWMVAVQRYTENEGWHDHPECVDPSIRALCILINDWLPDGDRERVIGPHLFAPVGTRSADLSPRRLRRVVEFAIEQAGVQHTLPEFPTPVDYRAAAEAAKAAWAAEAAAWAAKAAEAAEHRLLPLVLELCAMSTPAEPACPVRTREQVLREVCLVTAIKGE